MKLFLALLILSISSFGKTKNLELSEADKLIYKYSSNMDYKENVLVDIDSVNKAINESKKVLSRQLHVNKEKKKINSKITKIFGYEKNFPVQTKTSLHSTLIHSNEKHDPYYITFHDNDERLDSNESIIDIPEEISGDYSVREFELTSFDGMPTISKVSFEKNKTKTYNLPVFDKIDFYSNILDDNFEPDDSYLLLKVTPGTLSEMKFNKKNKKIFFNSNFKKINSFKHASYILIIAKNGLLKTELNIKGSKTRKSFFIQRDKVYYEELFFKKQNIDKKIVGSYHIKLWGDKRKSYKLDREMQRIQNRFVEDKSKKYFQVLKNKKLIKLSSTADTLEKIKSTNYREIINSLPQETYCVSKLKLKHKLDFLDYDFFDENYSEDLYKFSLDKGELIDGIIEDSKTVYMVQKKDYILNVSILYKNGLRDYLQVNCDASFVIENL